MGMFQTLKMAVLTCIVTRHFIPPCFAALPFFCTLSFACFAYPNFLLFYFLSCSHVAVTVMQPDLLHPT